MLKNWKYQWLSVENVTTKEKVTIHPPHDHKHTVGFYHQGTMKHVDEAIKAALAAKNNGMTLDGSKEQRSS